MWDYHNLYLKTDVVVLADIFENFRKLYLKVDGLDSSWNFTVPGLCWDSLVKK